jgi:hypothetical protein
VSDTDEFDGVTPDIVRAAEKRAAAIAAGRPAEEAPVEAAEPVKAKARRQTTRG